MPRPVRHVCDKLSDWEVMELYMSYRGGVSLSEIARRYRMSYSTARETVRRVEARARELGLRVT